MIYAISNRTFFSDQKEYLDQIERVAAAGPDGFILREIKDWPGNVKRYVTGIMFL